MNLILYPKLSTCSRRAIRKTKTSFGRTYFYKPKGNLLNRLSKETGLDIEAVYNQLMKERAYLVTKL